MQKQEITLQLPKKPPPKNEFITVRYGDNQQAILNPWCSTRSLLDSIRRKCNCLDLDASIDLVDIYGEPKNLPEHLHACANDFMDNRAVYIPIKIEKQSENRPVKYTPLLQNSEKYYPNLREKLQDMNRPQEKLNIPRSGSSRWHGMMKVLSKSNKTFPRSARRNKDRTADNTR